MVKDYIADFQAQVRAEVPITAADIVWRLEEAYQMAKSDRDNRGMTGAALGQAKVLGVGQADKGKDQKRIETMNAAELRALLGKGAEGRAVH